MKSTASTVFQTMRPPFLLLTPACLLLGAGSASHVTSIDGSLAALVMLGALCAHASVNMLNEYHDFKSGLDLHTQRTPFSGGSGALPAHPAALGAVLAGGLLALLVTAVLGAYFIALRGWALAPLGLLGGLLILTYTPWLNRHPLLCLVAPGLGFGVLMVTGTHLVLTGTHSGRALLVALVPFFLVNNLLLLNQYPDLEPDRAAGRRHFLVEHGPRTARWIFALFNLGAYGVVVVGVALGLLPAGSLLALLTAPLALRITVTTLHYDGDVQGLKPLLAMNVVVSLLTPALLGVGLML